MVNTILGSSHKKSGIWAHGELFTAVTRTRNPRDVRLLVRTHQRQLHNRVNPFVTLAIASLYEDSLPPAKSRAAPTLFSSF